MSVMIRLAKPEDTDAMWEIFHEVGKGGDSYPHTAETTKDAFLAYWFPKNANVYVAEGDGKVLGTYLLQENRMGRASHVANGAFMVHPDARGKKIGRIMGQHALDEAKRMGFQAMQFNFVVSTNQVAINLWKSLGFNVIGTIPQGFDHATLGKVDALIMHRFL